MCDGAELHLELLVGGQNCLAIRTFHRPLHGAGKIRYRTRPVALTESNLVRVINYMVIRKRFEELLGFRLMIVAPLSWIGLARPVDCGILRMPLPEYLPILRIPGIVQGLH